MRDVKLLHRTGRALANSRDRPECYEGNPFRATRDATAAARER